MKLIVGLGNPGTQYEHTRHNMGFDAIDLLSEKLKIEITQSKFQGLYGKKDNLILFKPQTFMNLSGVAVREITQFFKISNEDIIVISDDMDLPVGKIRLRLNGSSGGHNGLKNIIELLGTTDFKRVRIGIGKAPYNTIDYVLGKPSKEETILIKNAISNAVAAIETSLDKSFNTAMSTFNK